MGDQVTCIPLSENTVDTVDSSDAECQLTANIAALVDFRNANITRQTQEITPIPSALVNLKWMNRRDIHPLRVKEEIYGLVLATVVKANPTQEAKILELLEKHYQRIKAEEAETLTITRRLADGSWQGSLL
ncbi:cytoplasmic protein [Citrobacter sp. JGM124]|uniref:cytoplasmic protein n=1 Tax=Citrobacter sp. JGM124 TaxID=2799789 RepID=UPI001BABB16E|nr:cytoplasmic protein [Citrobacter sp. JGM124]MBS0849249.1 cytoplasmic protein [Citrobacter sp. JGM124]